MDWLAEKTLCIILGAGLIRAMSPVRILLIDDHAIFRSGLGMLLRSGVGNVQVLEANSLEEAMCRTMEAPDMLLLDILLQGLNGLDGIAPLKNKWPQTPVVMLSSDAAPETIRQALARGAAAFISKAETADNMLSIVKQVLRGKSASPLFPGETGNRLPESPPLTPRQSEVLDFVCRGLSNKVIGQHLGLSEHTVRGHVQAVLAALRVTSRSEAAYVARQRGLVA